MYTYGAPRVGNKAFADAFNERLKGDAWRITNKADIVPRCAPVAVLFAFAGVVWEWDRFGWRITNKADIVPRYVAICCIS
jgi:hypothetical protein